MLKKIREKNKIVLLLLLIVFSFLVELCLGFVDSFAMRKNKGNFILDKSLYTYDEKIVKTKIKNNSKNSIDEMLRDEETPVEDIEENAIEDLDDETVEYEEVNNKIVEIKIDRQYVNKIKINYETNNDQWISITYKEHNEYGDPVLVKKDVLLEKEFNYILKSIKKEISDIKIAYTENDNSIQIGNSEIMNNYEFNIIRLILILLACSVIYIFIIFRQELKSKIEIFFLAISLAAGVAMIICTPTLMRYSWDDIVHFPNAYNLFNNSNITTEAMEYARKSQPGNSNNNTESVQEVFRDYNYLNKNTYKIVSKEKKSTNFISYADYAYIPSAIVLKVCQIFKVPFVIMYNLGKLINLLIYSLIGYYILKHAKIGKNLMFIVLLIPTNIFLASQYSKDAYITVLLMLGISTFMNAYFSDEKISLKHLLVMILAILFGSLSKAIYIPILLLLLLLPNDKFKNKKQAIMVKLLIVLMTIAVLATFLLPTVANVSSNNISDIRGGSNVSSSRQLRLIMEQPLSFTKVFYDNFVKYNIYYFVSKWTLLYYCHLGIATNNVYYIILLLLTFVAITGEKSDYKIPTKIRISLLVLVGLIICFIMGSMYLSFTNVASTTIGGVQERYYLPLLVPLGFILSTNKIKTKFNDKNYNFWISIIIAIVLFYSIYTMMFIPMFA